MVEKYTQPVEDYHLKNLYFNKKIPSFSIAERGESLYDVISYLASYCLVLYYLLRAAVRIAQDVYALAAHGAAHAVGRIDAEERLASA